MARPGDPRVLDLLVAGARKQEHLVQLVSHVGWHVLDVLCAHKEAHAVVTPLLRELDDGRGFVHARDLARLGVRDGVAVVDDKHDLHGVAVLGSCLAPIIDLGTPLAVPVFIVCGTWHKIRRVLV